MPDNSVLHCKIKNKYNNNEKHLTSIYKNKKKRSNALFYVSVFDVSVQ